MPLGPNEAEALNNFVHTPSESAAGFIRFVREIKEQPGITFGCILDKYIIPLRPGRVLSIVGRPGAGKAQPVDSPVLTPSGWTTIGSLNIGDYVSNPLGGKSQVIGVFPQGEKEVFKVVMSDGSSAECCDEHLWAVESSKSRRNKLGVLNVLPLSSIRNDLTRGKDGGSKWFIPLVKRIDFDEHELPLDPYLVGVLLGDGCMSGDNGVSISSPDQEVLDNISSLLPATMSLKYISGVDYRITGGRAMRDSRGHHYNLLLNDLRSIGLSGIHSYEKFIPNQYLYSSHEQRISLLQGLMDADGSASGPNIDYCTSSPELAGDVLELVNSLGGKATISRRVTQYPYNGEKRNGKPSYRMHISLPRDIAPFKLSRKAQQYNPQDKYPPYRAIKSVESIGQRESMCIMLDSDNQLYITNDYIVTHNTSLGAALVSREAIRILANGEAESRYAAHITWEQSVEEMEALYQAAIPDVVQRFTTSDIAWGRVDTAALEKSLVKRPMLPVWLFGDSLYNTNIHTPPMTIDKVYYAVKAVYETYSMRPSVMFLDYIQDIPVLNEKERTQQVGRAMRMIKRLAIQVQCPIILGVQSNQRVDEYANPIPTPRDLEWSSVIFQKSDVTAAIWRPVTTWSPEEKDMVDVGGVQYKNSPELMIVKLWKQRGEQGYGQWAIHFDPATLKIADYETHRILL